MNGHLTRRGFIQGSLIGAVLAAGAPLAFPQMGLRQRLDWASFRRGRDFASFVDGIKKMRMNTNPADPRSWAYWSNVHVNNCPHGIPYFLAWHRGYLLFFERQLRAMSGNPALVLPYWDYYTEPTLPPEFLNSASWNPLYVQRVNTDVTGALTLAPFSNALTNMQRGLDNAFEPSLEGAPHNPVHDIIGGVMTSMQSPLDPIFWLHHANIDRLWNAWIFAGNGRTMPSRSDPYWSGNFRYSDSLSLARKFTFSSRGDLGYFYQNESMPVALAISSLESRERAQTDETGGQQNPAPQQSLATRRLPALPAGGDFGVSRMRQSGSGRTSLGGALNIALTHLSVTARVPVEAEGTRLLKSRFARRQSLPSASGLVVTRPAGAVKVVLDDVRITASGANGGFFYNLYLDLPGPGAAIGSEDKYLVGNLGPFRLMASLHHHGAAGAQLEFDATEAMRAALQRDHSEHMLSFIRVSGANSPQGEVISIGECRLELVDDDLA